MSPTSQKVSDKKVVTRSVSSASGKSLNSPNSSSSLLSTDEFKKVMSSIKSAQEETLSHCKALLSSQNKEFGKLKLSVDQLFSQISELRSENNLLREDLASLKHRVTNLESNHSINSPSLNSDAMPQLLHELTERDKCSYNFIVHGLPESTASLANTRIADDLKSLSDTAQLLTLSLPPDAKLFRLGVGGNNKARPLKVIFPSKELASTFINDFNVGKRNARAHSISISVVRDRTLLERKHIRRVYAELDERKKNGESNIMVKYRNGIPSIAPVTNRSVSMTNASSSGFTKSN